MEKKANYIEINESAYQSSLKFVNNKFEDELEKLLNKTTNESPTLAAPPRDFKIVTPQPGYCIKSFKVNTNEKYFINLCQTEEIPPPEDITENELRSILESDEPSNFRIPMSISEPRITKDKTKQPVEACDIAINPKFFEKIQKSSLFKEFLMALISEAVSEKFNVQLAQDKAVILNNRRVIGTLVQHRVRNKDIKTVLSSYKNPTENDKKKLIEISSTQEELKELMAKHPLVSEITPKETNNLKAQAARPQPQGHLKDFDVPVYKIRILKNELNKPIEIHAQFYIPKCRNANDVSLEMNDDRLVLTALKQRYFFDRYTSFSMKIISSAIFNLTSKVLHLRIPLKGN